MKNIKKILSLVAVCSVFATFSAITAQAAGEVTITPVVDVKIGSASYTTYTGQTLSEGDKVRIKYEYAGPATNEVWSEAWYDEDNDINYDAELKGGTSIVLSNFYVDLLDTTYFTAGNPVFYNSSSASDWLTKDATYATASKTDTGISFATMAAYVNAGIYKSEGRITQVVYTLTKDLDKDVVIGPSAGYNYIFKLATAGVDGVETNNVSYNTTNNGVKFNTVTLKGAAPEPTYEDKYVNATTVEFAALGDNEVAGTDVATAYKASYTFAGTEKAAAWTADDKQDLTINIANISGETTLGLIVTDGTVSNVQLKVTALAD